VTTLESQRVRVPKGVAGELVSLSVSDALFKCNVQVPQGGVHLVKLKLIHHFDGCFRPARQAFD
jgi:hypothetical protein